MSGAGMEPDALPAVEAIWVVEATYAEDAAERRPRWRAEHLARVVALKAAGTLLEGGAFADLSSSLLLVRAEDEAAALALVHEDVYTREGVWVGFGARAFGRVV